MPDPTLTYDLFISHATADDAVVDRIFDALTAAGLTAWVDHKNGVTYGVNWSRAIEAAATQCKACLFILSPRSKASEYCEAEWNRFLLYKRPVYPATIEPMPPTDIPLRLGIVQSADLSGDFTARLADLIAAIKGGMPAAPAAPPIPVRRVTGHFPHSQLDLPLVGRDTERAEVEGHLRDSARAVQVLGLGGVGKTRLSAEIAHTSAFRDGLIWQDLGTYPTLGTLTGLIRDHLELPPTAPDDAIWQALDRCAALIVLDNFETCAEPAAFAARLNRLNLSGGTRFLITSRHRADDVRNSRIKDLAAPSPAVAQAILRAMLEAEPPRFQPAQDQIAPFAAAARHHPRLMLYAVRWLKKYPVAHVLNLLRNLTGRDAEAALEDIVHKTLRQIEAEPDGAAAVAALRKLTVTRGGFTVEAAQALIGEDLAPLGTLTDWGLIGTDAERYEVDPLVAAAVGELPDDDPAHRAHLDYYEALARRHDEMPAHDKYLRLDVESANLEAAFEWTMRVADYPAAYGLANACLDFLANRGRFAGRMAWFTRLEVVLATSGDEELRAGFQNSLGIVYQEYPFGDRLGNLLRAINAYTEALRFRTAGAAPLEYARTQNNLGIAYADLAVEEDQAGNLLRAINAYTEALRFSTAEAAPLDYAGTQNNLGNAYGDLAAIEDQAGNLRRAIVAYTEALRFRTPEAAPLDYAGTQNNLGNAYGDLAAIEDRAGNLGRAIAAYTEALRFRTPEAAPFSYATIQNNLGAAYADLSRVEDRAGNLGRAIDAYTEALRFRTPEAAPLDYAMTQANKGIVHEDLGEIDQAVACWREAEKYYRLMGYIDKADMMQRWIDEADGRPS